ncbi:hypothetical protein GCM10018793_13880 [Streptomyces sulfonofaciens]|uniref:Cip1-like core domain-containing protein n=1 Tax=Streptomyces sulfonofaciens TaxID=68272 RepID=A0A919FXP6_9ACTN|nr:hypothetical protein [Streptomyces sulfonofaciens]GHH73938.1 hypothetical protein GCM10018793_13880 [Streptomyces sulfonofaciens]
MGKRPLLVSLAAFAALLLAAAPAALGAAGTPHPAGAPAAPAHRIACAPPVLFCENFDALAPGHAESPNWDTVATGGTLTVEAAGTGGRNLHVSTRGNGSAFLRVNGFAPPGNSFWGRLRVRVDAFPTAPDWAHWTLVEAAGEGPGLIRPLGGQYVPDVGGDLWGVGSDGGPTGDWTAWRESAPARAGVWQCLEWQMDAADNRIAVWINGRSQPDLTVDTTHHGGNPVDFVFPSFRTVELGWQLYQADPVPDGYDLRLDDIALSTERVGCEAGSGRGGSAHGSEAD